MTGPALSLMAQLRRLGVQVAIEDDHLSIDAPRGVVGPKLMEEIKKHKTGLMAILMTPMLSGGESDPAGDPEPWPGGRPAWVDGIMDGPDAKAAQPEDTGSLGYRRHLIAIRRIAAEKGSHPNRNLLDNIRHMT